MTRKYTSLPYTEFTTAAGNFDTTRSPIDRIVLHTIVGSASSAINRFGTIGSDVSAHYIISLDGKIYAGLEEYNTAYQAGSYVFNQRSIGIEHEDGGSPNSVRPDILYSTSAKLVADICKFYSIPCDNQHIFRHHDVPGASTACPDALDTDRIIREANALITSSQPPMDSTVTNKASYYDQVIHLLFTWGKVSEDNSNLYDFTAVSGVLIGLKQERDFLASKATKWDALCNTLGFTDSNTVEVIDIENKIKEQTPQPTVGTTSTPEATTTTPIAVGVPECQPKEYKSPLANLLVIIADKLG